MYSYSRWKAMSFCVASGKTEVRIGCCSSYSSKIICTTSSYIRVSLWKRLTFEIPPRITREYRGQASPATVCCILCVYILLTCRKKAILKASIFAESDNFGSTDSEVKKILTLHLPISEYDTLGSDSEADGRQTNNQELVSFRHIGNLRGELA